MKKKALKMCSIILVFAMLSTYSIIFAAASDFNDLTPDRISIEKAITDIDEELQSNGTSIEVELTNLRSQYSNNAVAAESSEEMERWMKLASGVDILINDYASYKSLEQGNLMP